MRCPGSQICAAPPRERAGIAQAPAGGHQRLVSAGHSEPGSQDFSSHPGALPSPIPPRVTSPSAWQGSQPDVGGLGPDRSPQPGFPQTRSAVTAPLAGSGRETVPGPKLTVTVSFFPSLSA